MKHELTPQRKERRIMAVWTSLVLTTALFTTSAFAADSDPLTIVNNLSDFIFSCIKAIGIIILGWGVVQLGMSGRWFADSLCKGNSDGYRRGVSKRTAPRLGTHFS